MLRSVKSRVCIGTGTLSVLSLAFYAGAAVAQTATPPGAVIRPPVARQIEPMVAPVRRVAPKTSAVPLMSALQPVGTQGLAAASVTSAQPNAVASAVASAAPPLLGKTPAAATTPKIVVYTCRIGQDFSERLKACITPGVTKVAGAAKALKAKVGGELENAKRSALGAAKRKS
jgi:hypothetical protein